MKRILLIWIVLQFPMVGVLYAQKSENLETQWNLSADIVSRYVWRGMQLSDGLNIQPTIEYSIGNFTVGTWASYGVGIPFAEVDLYVEYTLGNFSFLVSDYYDQDEYQMSANNYLNWRRGETGHAVEGAVTYSGSERFPISITAATFFYGCDDSDEDSKSDYSTYLELGYTFGINYAEMNVFVGGTPYKSTYCSKAGIVNVGFELAKEVQLSSNFKLPTKGAFVVNPNSKQVFLVFSIGF